MPLPIFHHPGYDAEFPATHRFPMGKYRRLAELLEQKGLIGAGGRHVPDPADARTLALAHDPAYVAQVIECRVPHAIEREIGFPIGEKVAMRARLASAGTLAASREALSTGLACNAAGGSHHARRAQGAGFCTFNDVGVAASTLLREGAAQSILVVDCDVHQGDGTADIFCDEPRVFTFSIHGDRNYPTRKIASDLDIGLPDNTGDAAYLEVLGDALTSLRHRIAPDIVFYNAGVDPHADDRLGRLAMSDRGLAERDRRVIAHFRDRAIPLCGVIGGGYANDLEALARRHAILFEVAAEFA